MIGLNYVQKWDCLDLKLHFSCMPKDTFFTWRGIVTFTCDLDLAPVCWVMGSAHRLTEVSIWPKILAGVKVIWSRRKIKEADTKLKVNSCDMQLWPWTSWHGWVIGSAHRLTAAKFDQSLIQILPGVKDVWKGHKTQGSKSWPSFMTLTLSRHGLVMGSAHHLTEANIWPKFNENPSRSNGDMERTQN